MDYKRMVFPEMDRESCQDPTVSLSASLCLSEIWLNTETVRHARSNPNPQDLSLQ